MATTGSTNGGVIGPVTQTTTGGPIAASTTPFTAPGTYNQTLGAPGDLEVLVVGGGGGAGQRKATFDRDWETTKTSKSPGAPNV